MFTSSVSRRNFLVESYLSLALTIAKRYQSLDPDDLFQEGCLGLITAASKFDPSRGSFPEMAAWWIRQTIERAIQNQARTIRLPVYISNALQTLARVTNSLAQSLGRPPSTKEIGEAMRVSHWTIERLLTLGQGCLSLDAVTSEEDEETCLMDETADPEAERQFEEIETREARQELAARMKGLSEIERRVINLRYGLDGEEPMTLEAIGRIMRVTRARIHQIECKALGKMRSNLGDPRPSDF